MSTQVTDRAARLWDDGARWDAILPPSGRRDSPRSTASRPRWSCSGCPLADAKRVVHDSQTWADVRGRDDEWHDSLVAEMDATESRS